MIAPRCFWIATSTCENQFTMISSCVHVSFMMPISIKGSTIMTKKPKAEQKSQHLVFFHSFLSSFQFFSLLLSLLLSFLSCCGTGAFSHSFRNARYADTCSSMRNCGATCQLIADGENMQPVQQRRNVRNQQRSEQHVSWLDSTQGQERDQPPHPTRPTPNPKKMQNAWPVFVA